jgi:hypothetical protein
MLPKYRAIAHQATGRDKLAQGMPDGNACDVAVIAEGADAGGPFWNSVTLNEPWVDGTPRSRPASEPPVAPSPACGAGAGLWVPLK